MSEDPIKMVPEHAGTTVRYFSGILPHGLLSHEKNHSQGKRLYLTLCALFVAPAVLGIAVFWFLARIRSQVESSLSNSLQTVLETTDDALKKWVEDEEADVTVLAANNELRWRVEDQLRIGRDARLLRASEHLRDRVSRQRMESKTERSLEFRYAVSLLGVFTLFVLANCWDYVKYSALIAAYDVIVPFGLPFVMVVKGGAVVVLPEIVWNGVAANAFLVLWIAAVVAWLWHKIASR